MTMAAATDRFAGAWSWTRTNASKAALEIGVNFALPYLIYSAAHGRLGDVGALIASSTPPLAWGVAEFVRRRRVDALSLLALTGIVLSVIAFAGGGGVRFLQLRERLVTALIGMVFLGSAVIGKPLIYQLAKARLRRGGAHDQLGVLQSLQDGPQFQRVMMIATVAWGVALVGESAICAVMVFTLSIKAYMIASSILGYSALGLMTAWTFWYMRRRVTAMARAAMAAQAAASPDTNLSQP